MFKNREKFNKFLSIATPILFGVNLGLVLLKFIGAFAMPGDFTPKMFMFAFMYNDPAVLVNLHYMFSGLIFTANIAYGVLSFVALSMIKDDQKHRALALTFAIVSLVWLVLLTSIGFNVPIEKASYWVIPFWFIGIAYHIAFPLIFFLKFLKIKKQ